MSDCSYCGGRETIFLNTSKGEEERLCPYCADRQMTTPQQPAPAQPSAGLTTEQQRELAEFVQGNHCFRQAREWVERAIAAAIEAERRRSWDAALDKGRDTIIRLGCKDGHSTHERCWSHAAAGLLVGLKHNPATDSAREAVSEARLPTDEPVGDKTLAYVRNIEARLSAAEAERDAARKAESQAWKRNAALAGRIASLERQLAAVRELVRKWRDPEHWKKLGAAMDTTECADELEAAIAPSPSGEEG